MKDTAVPPFHKVRISSIHVLCGCWTLIALWSNPVNFGECSVRIVVLRFLPQALPRDAYWIWQNSTETERRCSNLKESLHIQILLCLIFSSPPPPPAPPAELVDRYFSHKSLFHEKFMSSQQSAYNCVPCRTGATVHSIQYTDTLVLHSLHGIYLVSLSYHYFICCVCFCKKIFLK